MKIKPSYIQNKKGRVKKKKKRESARWVQRYLRSKIFNTLTAQSKLELQHALYNFKKMSADIKPKNIMPRKFPKKFKHTYIKRNYIEKLKGFIREIHIKELKHFVDKTFLRTREKKQKKPRLKDHIVDYLFCKLFNLTWHEANRKVESKLICKLPERIVLSLCKITVPEEILLHIFGFLPKKGSRFLNRIGCVNEKWYISALKSYNKIRISKSNLKKIPLLVMRNCKFVKFDVASNFYVKDWKYMTKEMRNLQELVVEGDVCKFLKLLESRSCKPLGIRKLAFRGYRVYFHLQSFTDKTKLALPRLRELEIPLHNTSLEKWEILKQIETLKFSAISSLREIFLRIYGPTEKESYSLPLFGTLPQLKCLIISSNLLEDSYKRIANVKGLKKLNLFISIDKSISHLNEYIYTNCMNLESLVLDIHISNAIKKDYLEKIHFLKDNLKYLELNFRCCDLDIKYIRLELLSHLESMNELEKVLINITYSRSDISFLDTSIGSCEEDSMYLDKCIHKLSFSNKIVVKTDSNLTNHLYDQLRKKCTGKKRTREEVEEEEEEKERKKRKTVNLSRELFFSF